MLDASSLAASVITGAAMVVLFAAGRSILKLAILHLLLTSLLLGGCVTSGVHAPHQNNIQQDLSGDWRVYYNIPDTMVYGLSVSVTVDETGLPDQSGSWGAPEDLNSRISEGVAEGGSVKFRWIYQNVGANGETGPVLWDHSFEGHYGLNENGEEVLRGALSGTELNGLCEYPVPTLTPSMEKLPNGDCPRHRVTGTWYAMRDIYQ